jgi:hypothetical protein
MRAHKNTISVISHFHLTKTGENVGGRSIVPPLTGVVATVSRNFLSIFTTFIDASKEFTFV